MSKRESDAVAAILADPENDDRTAEERPRAAWDFFRPGEPPDPRHLRIMESITRWETGKWAQERPIKPVCHCGMIEHPRRTSTGDVVGLGPCPRHAA